MSMEFTLNDLQRRRVEEHLALVEQVLRRSIKTNETVDGMGHDDLYQDGCIALCRASVSYMPIQIALPPTSLTPYTRFVNEAFLSRRRKVCTGVVRIGLKKAVSGSHEYCVATFTKIADFAGEDLAHIRAYADGFVAQIKDINAQRAQAGAAASSIIGDGDTSHLELPDNGAHFALGAVIDGEREELPA